MKEFHDLLLRLCNSNELEDVNETFEDFNLRVVQNIPLISTLQAGTKEESEEFSVLVEASKGSINSISERTPSESEASSTDIGLDITGSPLRCPFDEDLLQYTDDTLSSQQNGLIRGKKCLAPIDATRARVIASMYNRSVDFWLKTNGFQKPCPFMPMWVMCNGNDSSKILVIGCHWKRNKLGRTIVTDSGPINHQSNLMTLQQLKKKHAFGLNSKDMDVEVISSYVVNDCSIFIPDASDEVLPSSVVIFAKWYNCRSVLEFPPSDAQCTVVVTGKPECHESLTHSMYEELEKVQALDNLKVTSTPLYDPFSVDKGLLSKVEKLIEESRNIPVAVGRRQVDPEQSVMSQSEKSILSCISRRELDFCDKLWNTLKDFKNMSDLAKCFELVFLAAKQKKLLKVHKRSSTTIANVIADKTEPPFLHEFVPLELLVELGLEKLRRDCFHFFTASEMATKEQLRFYMDSELNITDALLRLRKLNYIIEVILTVSLSLKLQDNILRIYTRNILQHFVEKEVGLFDYKIHPSVVDTWLKGDRETWKVVLTSTDTNIVKRTLLHISQNSVADWVLNTDLNSSGFVQTLLTEIADNVLGRKDYS